MADAAIGPWPIEDVPDEDDLYLRVHRRWFDDDGDLDLGCFQNHPKKTGGMSTDWSRYATPEDTQRRARRPDDNAVIALSVGRVRSVPDQLVVHSPMHGQPELEDNLAHTDVLGTNEGDLEIRRIFQRLATIVLPLRDVG